MLVGDKIRLPQLIHSRRYTGSIESQRLAAAAYKSRDELTFNMDHKSHAHINSRSGTLVLTSARTAGGEIADWCPRAGPYLWLRHAMALVLISGLYLILGFYQIDNQSLWTDEVISINRITATDSLSAWLTSQSPLYFVLLDLWAEIVGTTEFALRSLSAVFGLAAIILFYALGLQLFDRRAALLAAILFATSPYLIWYAQEVRYVTLLLVASLAMTYCFQRALTTRDLRWWVAYSLASSLALFTFVTSIFLVCSHALYILLNKTHRPFLKKWVASQLIIVCLFSIWFLVRTAHRLPALIFSRPDVTSSQQGRSHDTLPVTDLLGAIPYTFFAFSVGFSLGPSLEDLHEARSLDTLINYSPVLVPVALLFTAFFAVGVLRLGITKQADSFLVLWLVVPIIGAFVVATTTAYHVYNTRYVALALPAYLLVLGVGITALRRTEVQVALLLCVLVINGISLYNYYYDGRYARADARSAAQYLESNVKSGEVVLVVGNPIALQHYYSGSIPLVPLNPSRNEQQVRDLLRKVMEEDRRVWLVEVRRWESDPRAIVKTFLDNSQRRREAKEFPGVYVYAYVG